MPNLPIPKRIEEITRLLEPHGIDFNQFLKQLKTYQRDRKYLLGEDYLPNKEMFDQKRDAARLRKKYFLKHFKKNNYVMLVNPQIGAKFRIVCYQDKVSAGRLIESFMSAYIEGEPELESFLCVSNLYHKKRIFKRRFKFNERQRRMARIIKFYNIPQEWWLKFTDLKSEYLD